MNRGVRFRLWFALTLALGCAPLPDDVVAHGALSDAGPPRGDGGHVLGDAASAPHDAAHAADTGTHPVDAYVVRHDAYVARRPDAYACPTYAGAVEPIYVRHCGSCHTTGSDPHFGSSYTIAAQSTSACHTTMAECTIELGQPGGSMSYRDSRGGFDAAELHTLRAWIACGRPR